MNKSDAPHENASPNTEEPKDASKSATSPGSPAPRKKNNVRAMRIERMVSKAELARRAHLSVLTIDRVEKGYGCRMDTKRKILEALGLSLADARHVFGEEE
ncbi:MAG: helix-turn-helix transcriptional regulator [Myxococcales bacterium]|nr:helix-turn-helix transcriptional regulator [Myxococcales bacterium]MCB9708740.1 helix-turn-helix transcriptional regulator [Myxococcales bacterium]